jgi:hypothetical protein
LNTLPDGGHGARHGISVVGTPATSSNTLAGKWSVVASFGIVGEEYMGPSAGMLQASPHVAEVTCVGALSSTNDCAAITMTGRATAAVR